MSKTDTMKVRFRVCESDDGSPYLGLLEDGSEINLVLKNKNILAIPLGKGTSVEEATKLCDHLNKYVTNDLTFP